MGKKSSRPPASKTSSAAAPAADAATMTASKSSILRSAFSPSEYQLALFASVIQGLDSQHLRVHDIHTGTLQCEHAVAPRESITSLDWGYFNSQREQNGPKKKRKRNSNVHGAVGDAVIAFGTSSSDIRIFSPEEGKVLGSLSGVHSGGIRDFKFTAGNSTGEGWSIGEDNRLVQWDLRTCQSIRTINIPTSSTISALARPTLSDTSIICATQTPTILDVEKLDTQPLTFPAMANPIHTLLSSTKNSKDGNFLAADNARYITVFDPKTKGIAHSLVAEKEVSSLSLYSAASSLKEDGDVLSKQVLAVLINDGTIEFFNRPFLQSGSQGGTKPASLKARAKQMTRKADAVVKIVHPESRKGLSVVQADFQGSELFIAWAEGGVNVVFERVKWKAQDTEELAFSGVNEIAARKSPSVLRSAAVQETRNASKSHVNENGAAIESGAFTDEVEMNGTYESDAESILEEDISEDDEIENRPTRKSDALANGVKDNEDVEMQEAADSGVEENDEASGEPTFGELVQRSSAIDVEAELHDNSGGRALIPGASDKTVYQIPSGVSLSTVLSQALKTNDIDMLESCFHARDLNIVRATIQRLDSTLAGILLQKVAERMAARPGRYGHLLVWVQFTCITHGGAIAGNTDILRRMTSLYKVMDQRSRTLPSLLLLKGKLDMLDAQVKLRQSMSEDRTHREGDDEEILERVTHYAGTTTDTSEAERRRKRKAAANTPRLKATDTEEADDLDDIPNGFGLGVESDEEEEGSDEDADEDGDLIDIEAEESDAEESLEENEDEDDDEDDDDDDSDAGSDMGDFIADSEEDVSDVEALPAPPPKKAKLSGKGKKGGRS